MDHRGSRYCKSRSGLMPFLLAVLCLLLAAAPSSAEKSPPATGQPPLNGAGAVRALGDQLPAVAARYGKSAAELANLLMTDTSLLLDGEDNLVYVCAFNGPPIPASELAQAMAVETAAYPYEQTFLLHSRPGATRAIYLDFDGNVTSGTAWNQNFTSGQDIASAPFDLDGDPATFSAAERDLIQGIWQRVAEDFIPYDVDVTTQDPGVEALRKTGPADGTYGQRVVIGPTNWFSNYSGGVAYVGSFNWELNTPGFVFAAQLSNGEKYIAEAVSHEAGHTLGLSHDGTTVGDEYYTGQGDWAPIMGVGYYSDIVQWSKGEYSNANNHEDDLAVMQNYGISYRADDDGNTPATATPLTSTVTAPTTLSLSGAGIIEQTTDVDVFSFQAGDGSVAISINPAPRSPDLDILAELRDAAGKPVASNDPPGLTSSLSAVVPAGTYYLFIDGAGEGDPLTTGYSDYGSLGQYTISGKIVSAGNTPPVAVASVSPASGPAPLAVSFSSAGSYDPAGTIAGYAWDFGDGSTSPDPNPTHVYASAGSYVATLTVTGNAGLTATAGAAVAVAPAPNRPPVAAASANPVSGTAPLTVNFSSAGSSDPDGAIAGYAWVFGDGSTSPDANPTHVYASAGSYIATLTVTDVGGLTGTASVAVSVAEAPAQPPVASFVADPSTGVVPLTVSFSASASADPSGAITAYAWSYGDGSTGAGVATTHTYASPGSYTAVLTVTDNRGAAGSKSAVITGLADPNRRIWASGISLVQVSVSSAKAGQATVTITSAGGTAISGAAVTGTWSGLVRGNSTGRTGANGTVAFTSKTSRKTGALTFTVTGVTPPDSSSTYDASQNFNGGKATITLK